MSKAFNDGSLYFKPGLHIVVTITEHASDDAMKRFLRLATHPLQIFLLKYKYLQSLQPCEDQGIRERLEKRVCNHVLVILMTYMETRLQVHRYPFFFLWIIAGSQARPDWF